jgi:VWA domain-containing protein
MRRRFQFAVLLDVSASMSNKIETEWAALEDFFNNANPQDEYFAIAFSDRPRLVASSTSSIDEMQRQLKLAATRRAYRDAGCDLFGRGPVACGEVQAPGDRYFFRRWR